MWNNINNKIISMRGDMRVCVLSDETFGNYTPESFLKNYEWKMYNVKRPAFDFIRDIALSEPYDVYMNLCDGSDDEDRPGIDVVQALEALNLPFTGADSGFYAPTREQVQILAERKNVGCPRGFQVKAGEDVDARVAKAGLRFPLIVKHHDSYASVGMTRDSRVENAEQLRIRFDLMCDQYGAARVEEFVDGREFTVLIADNPDNLDEPYVYHPLEIIFPATESFKHWAMKFDLSAGADMDLAQVSDPALVKRLKTMVRRIYLALGGVGYGRADIRMNQAGELFLLEINSNPSLLNVDDEKASADYMMEYDEGGSEGFLERVFHSAIVRREKRMLPPQLTRRRKLVPVEVQR
jgi:D-alanine-D-alanine ligase